jgi:rhodanese-related sulfurtransferase
MKKTGTYEIKIGDLKGTIEVIEYTKHHYKAVSSREAEKIIKNIDPIVLDVRTPMEYNIGHLKGSILIPVRELQYRYKEMESHKNRDILIYCATGNRSTVAAKILIDNGFKKIYNLSGGITDWSRSGLPVN